MSSQESSYPGVLDSLLWRSWDVGSSVGVGYFSQLGACRASDTTQLSVRMLTARTRRMLVFGVCAFGLGVVVTSLRRFGRCHDEGELD